MTKCWKLIYSKEKSSSNEGIVNIKSKIENAKNSIILRAVFFSNRTSKTLLVLERVVKINAIFPINNAVKEIARISLSE